METSTTRIAFSVRDILNMPESKEKEVETKATKELDVSIKRPSTEHADRPPSEDEKDLKESTLKGRIIIPNICPKSQYPSDILVKVLSCFKKTLVKCTTQVKALH